MDSGLNFLILKELKKGGVDFAVSVPCKLLSGLILALEKDSDIKYFHVTREEEGVGICAGAFLGGKFPCIVMQNSGIGNCINALSSLLALYRIPVVFVISHRGTPGEKINAQFQMAQLTEGFLDLLRIPVFKFRDRSQVNNELAAIAKHAWVIEYPVAVLMDFQFWSK